MKGFFRSKYRWHPASGNFGWLGSTKGARSAKKARKKIDATIPVVKQRKGAIEGFYKGMGDIASAEKNIGDLSALESFLTSSYDIKRASEEKLGKTGLATIKDRGSDMTQRRLRRKQELDQKSSDLTFQKGQINLGMQERKDLYSLEDLIRQLEMERINY